MESRTLQAAISLYHEHGIFLTDQMIRKFRIEPSDPIKVVLNEVATYELCKRLSEVDPKKEAKALLAAFEAVVRNHCSFLSRYGITNRLVWKATPSFSGFDLGKVHPDFNISKHSLFASIYRKIEDLLIGLDSFSEEQINSASFKKLTNDTLNSLTELLNNYYAKVDCVVGAGTWLSLQMKDIEVAFSVSDFEIGAESKIGYEKPLAVNPYILFWLLNGIGVLDKGKPVFKTYDIEIEPVSAQFVRHAERVVFKVFLASEKDFSVGADEDKVRGYLKDSVLLEKTFFLPHDVCFPLSCPSIIKSVEPREAIPYVEPSPYGSICQELVIPKFTEETKIDIEFYRFPLFNKRFPVVLDTSSIDISRFPYHIENPFFINFLYERTIAIPRAVIYETKIRYGTKDKVKVLKALMRLRQLKDLGLINDIVLVGEPPRIPRGFGGKRGKKYVEDMIDSLVLDAALETGGVLFTNDRELAEFAFLLGVPTISYVGLEDDIRTVIKQNDLKLTIDECIKKVREYSILYRGAPYRREDIKSTLQMLINSGEVEVIDGKLHYVARSRMPKYKLG